MQSQKWLVCRRREGGERREAGAVTSGMVATSSSSRTRDIQEATTLRTLCHDSATRRWIAREMRVVVGALAERGGCRQNRRKARNREGRWQEDEFTRGSAAVERAITDECEPHRTTPSREQCRPPTAFCTRNKTCRSKCRYACAGRRPRDAVCPLPCWFRGSA